MDSSGCFDDDNDHPAFKLIYPLSVEFDRQDHRVHLQTLEFGVINTAHLLESRQALRENDVLLFKRSLSMPWKYHLYILINVREESYNVNFVTVLLRQAFDVHRSVNIYNEKPAFRSEAYYRYDSACNNDDAQTSVSGGRKRSKRQQFNLSQKSMLPRLSRCRIDATTQEPSSCGHDDQAHVGTTGRGNIGDLAL